MPSRSNFEDAAVNPSRPICLKVYAVLDHLLNDNRDGSAVLTSLPQASAGIAEVPVPQTTAQRLKAVVKLVLSHAKHEPLNLERRIDSRMAFPSPIQLTPIDSCGVLRTELSTAVIGRYLTYRGLDFYHQTPLPYNNYRCLLPCQDEFIAVSLQVNWSRCNEYGWMESGGYFYNIRV